MHLSAQDTREELGQPVRRVADAVEVHDDREERDEVVGKADVRGAELGVPGDEGIEKQTRQPGCYLVAGSELRQRPWVGFTPECEDVQDRPSIDDSAR